MDEMDDFPALQHLGALEDLIARTVSGFTVATTEAEAAFLEQLLTLTARLELDPRQSIKKSVSNLQVVNELRRDMELALTGGQYGKAVEQMLNGFLAVQSPINAYFTELVGTYGADKLYRETTKLYIKATAQELVANGVAADFVPGITKILNTHVTSGASLRDLRRALGDYVVEDPKLSKAAAQVADDALNQYSRQYIQSQTADLGLRHYLYKGTAIETSRGFCLKHVGKYYTEEEVLSWGAEAERGVKWPGQYKGTTKANIKVVLGGYRCRHRLAPVTSEMYEAGLKRQAARAALNPPTPEPAKPTKPAKAKKPLKPAPPTPTPTPAPDVPPVVLPTQPKRKKAPKAPDPRLANRPEEFDTYPAQINPEFWGLHNRKPGLIFTPKGKGSFYQPGADSVTIDTGDRWQKSPYFQKKIVYHEFGHALHSNRGIHTDRLFLANGGFSPDKALESSFSDCKKLIRGKAGDAHHEELNSLYFSLRDHFTPGKTSTLRWRPFLDELQAAGYNQHDISEMVVGTADTLAALTKGQKGWGHSKAYFAQARGSKTRSEFFAHGMELRYLDNPVFEKVMPGVKARMLEYFTTIKPE